jgi:isoquinoline 1-oxidoreductase beta subunit
MSRLIPADEIAHPLSRRNFLVASTGAGWSSALSALVEAAMDPAVPGGVPDPSVGPSFEPGLWFAIDGERDVTVNIIRAEMGQHVGTALARILADELDVDWDKVRIVHVDTDPKWGYDGHRRQLVGVADLPDLQPGRRGRAHRPGRGGREAAERAPAGCTARGGKW